MEGSKYIYHNQTNIINIGIMESESPPKYRRVSIIFLGFSVTKIPYMTEF